MCRSIITLACICLFSYLSYSSSIVPFNNLEHLSQTSDLVVVVKALPERTISVNGYTEYLRDFEVLDFLKGHAQSLISIKSGKRSIGDLTNIIHGEFDFHSQDTYLLFLQEQADGSYYPVCLSYYVFQEISKKGKSYFVPRYEEGELQLLGNKKEHILRVFEKEAFVSSMKNYAQIGSQIRLEDIAAPEEEQSLRDKIKKASPAHCTFLQSNNGLRYQVKDLGSQALPIHYQSAGAECTAVAAELNAAINHMNDNYSGINLQLENGTTGYVPDCAGNRAYNISFFGGNYDIYMEQNFGTSRAVMIQFGDPCNEIPALNNCSGTVAFGGTWAIGSHLANGETFNTAVYGYVLVNEGMGNCNCGDFTGNSPISDFSAIIAHELSHTVGLNHISSQYGQANMNPTSGTQVTNLDIQCMDDLYPGNAISNPDPDPDPDPEPTGSADLRISSCGAVSISNKTVSISNLQIHNRGNAATVRTSRVGIYVSTDNVITTADQLMVTVAVPVLGAGSSVNVNASFNTNTIPDGSYVVGMFVDDSRDVTESNESNNTCFDMSPRLIIEAEPVGTPDLSISRCGSVSMSNKTVNVSNLQIQNTGTAPTTKNSRVGIYISTDNNINTSDQLMTTVAVPLLAPGASITVNTSFNTNTIPDGNYLVGMFVDDSRDINESNESNNICVDESPRLLIEAEPAGQADLSISQCARISISGRSVTLNNLRVANSGTAAAPAGAVINYYLSTDNTITTADLLIGSYRLPRLDAGASLTVNQNFNTSSRSLADGNYTVGLIIDAANTIAESNESNNSCFDNSPQLIIDTAVPAQVDLKIGGCGRVNVNGSIVTINNLVVQNTGNTTSGTGARVGYYLSIDNAIRTTDYLLGAHTLPSLTASASTSINKTYNISGIDIEDGTYKVGMIIDDTNSISESDESNNSCRDNSSVVVIDSSPPGMADLRMSSCGALTINETTATITNAIVRNGGSIASTAGAIVNFYVSADQAISRNDRLIGGVSLASLAPNETVSINQSVVISSLNLVDGIYFIGAIVDVAAVIPESNESNNTCIISTPHLVIKTEQAPSGEADLDITNCGSATINGNSISINQVVVRNVGSIETNDYSFLGYYLSKDINVTTDDIYLGYDYVNSLVPNSQSAESATFNISNLNLTDGEYYIGAFADFGDRVTEDDETNNSCYIRNPKVVIGQVSAPDPIDYIDLTVSCGDISQTSTSVSLNNVVVRNRGSQIAESVFVGYYLSKDQTITTDDYLLELGQDYIASLRAGTQKTESGTFSLSGIPNGDYFFGAIVDHTNVVSESNEQNNSCLIATTKIKVGAVINGQPDLAVRCPSASLRGNDLVIDNVTTRNNGDAGTGGYSFVGYYLSTDQEITTSDHYIGYDFVGVLAAGATNTQNETFQLNNLNIGDGDYYLGAVADFTSRIRESNLTNNTCVYDDVLVRIGQINEAVEGECAQFNANDFEDGKLGVWTDGGEHAFINAGSTFAASGVRSVAIRGNKADESSIYSAAWIEKGAFTDLNISFNYYAFLMEAGDSFVLEVDEGTGYTVAKEWKAGVDFKSSEKMHAEFSLPLNTDVKLKLKCVSSHTYEYVFLDDILIERCQAGSGLRPTQASANSQSGIKERMLSASIFPNPVARGEAISIVLGAVDREADATVFLFDGLGRQLRKSIVSKHSSLDTDDLQPGTYVVMAVVGDDRFVQKLVVY